MQGAGGVCDNGAADAKTSRGSCNEGGGGTSMRAMAVARNFGSLPAS
jgi:hypothetical protein